MLNILTGLFPASGAAQISAGKSPRMRSCTTQMGATHQSHSLSTTDQLTHDLQGNSTAYELPAFTTLDGALGVGKDAWLVQIYGENLTDTRAQLFVNYSQYYKAITVNRPRTVGLRYSYKFNGR